MERVIKIVTVIGNYIRQMMTVNMMNLIYTTHPFCCCSTGFEKLFNVRGCRDMHMHMEESW